MADISVYVLEKEQKDQKFENDSAVIISLLNNNRYLKLYLDKLWGEDVPTFYLDEIFMLDKLTDFLNHNKNIYIYGAGNNGKELLNCLNRFNYHVNGFVVSNGRRTEASWNGTEILEFGELKDYNRTGIIVAVDDKIKNEITDLLIKSNYKNFIIF